MSQRTPQPYVIRRYPSPQQLRDLNTLERNLTVKLCRSKQKLKTFTSYNNEFWDRASYTEELAFQLADIQAKIALRGLSRYDPAWIHTDTAKAIFEQLRANQMIIKLCIHHAIREAGQPSSSGSREFTPNKGIDVKYQLGHFRSLLMYAYDSVDETGEWVWCPILRRWSRADSAQILHLFPAVHGQEQMDAVFKREKRKGPPLRLFIPENGLLVSGVVAPHLDTGKLVIVPDVGGPPQGIIECLKGGVLKMLKGKKQEYMIKVIDPTWEDLDDKISPRLKGLTWRELDGRRLQFRSGFRPSKQYLYFHYCTQMIYRAWQVNPGLETALSFQNVAGNAHWRESGKYIPGNMLRAVLEELGTEYEALLKGSTTDCDDKDSHLILQMVASQIGT